MVLVGVGLGVVAAGVVVVGPESGVCSRVHVYSRLRESRRDQTESPIIGPYANPPSPSDAHCPQRPYRPNRSEFLQRPAAKFGQRVE